MRCMSMPEKYLSMGSFYKYYSGEKVAPIPTLFIHGNHECVNYLKELYFGGWVAPNIYYMGYSGVINFGGVRIGGLSGIWSAGDYQKGHCERPPYRGGSCKSAYHVREYEVFKLSQIKGPMDVFLSHDWPRGIYHFGDKARLIHQKPFFVAEIDRDELGSVAAQHVLLALQPRYWFSAHLHVKFAALLPHANATTPNKSTRFLALDKCLPGRDFLQILDIEPSDPNAPNAQRDESGQFRFYYDDEWLAILKATMPLYSTDTNPAPLPASVDTQKPLDQIRQDYTPSEGLRVPLNFQRTVVAYNPVNPQPISPYRMADPMDNPQTIQFAAFFGIPMPAVPEPNGFSQTGHSSHSSSLSSFSSSAAATSSSGSSSGSETQSNSTMVFCSSNAPTSFSNDGAANPDEINLDEE